MMMMKEACHFFTASHQITSHKHYKTDNHSCSVPVYTIYSLTTYIPAALTHPHIFVAQKPQQKHDILADLGIPTLHILDVIYACEMCPNSIPFFICFNFRTKENYTRINQSIRRPASVCKVLKRACVLEIARDFTNNWFSNIELPM